MKKHKVHYIGETKTLCGLTPTIDDTRSISWFSGMRIKCKTCDKIYRSNPLIAELNKATG